MPERVWTIVVAAGTGQRFGTEKQYEDLGGRRLLDWAVDAATGVSEGVVVVVTPAHADRGEGIAGGATRSDSVRRGLDHVPDGATIICVHDGARPLATSALFERVIGAVRNGADAGVPGLPVADTVKEVDEGGAVVATLDRSRLVTVQTPQAFRAEVLRKAHADEGDATDDASLVERLGGHVVVVEGEPGNTKVTVPEDLERARRAVAGAG